MNQLTDIGAQYRRLYKNHGDQIGYWEGWIERPNMVVMQHAKSIDGKAVRQVYHTEGKNIGRANETSPYTQAGLELESRTNKKLDKGYVTSQAAAQAPATNTLGLRRPMLATPLDKIKPEKIEWATAFAQPKLDGHRALFSNGVLYTREGKELDMPHITKAIRESGLDDLHLDGELYLHGYRLQEISRLIKRYQEGTEHLEYHIYDTVEPLPFSERNALLSSVTTDRSLHPRIRLVETTPIIDMAWLMEAHQHYRKRGYEGTMLRFGDEPYQDGKRSRSLVKLKEFHDAEFTIVGVTDGKPYITPHGTYQVPVWVLDAGNGKTFTATAQGNMQEKHELWQSRTQHLGRQLTVKYHYLSVDGIPQLPVALRFHETL